MKSLIATAALTATVLTAAPAAAQLGGGKEPIDVTADVQEIVNSTCTTIFRGSAEALQGTSRLRADVLTAHMAPQKGTKGSGNVNNPGCGELESIDAQGSVYFVTPQRRVHGDAGVYDAASTTLTITGDVVAVEGKNVMRGARMIYNTQTGAGRVEGTGTGPNAKNRPRAVLYPKDADTGGGSGANSSKDKARS